MCTNRTCTNPTLSAPIIPADQSRASIWGRDLITPGVVMEQPSLFQVQDVAKRHAKPKDTLTLGNRAMQHRCNVGHKVKVQRVAK